VWQRDVKEACPAEDGEKAQMVNTDPPYGELRKPVRLVDMIKNDDLSGDELMATLSFRRS
jgi:hypothetical protein